LLTACSTPAPLHAPLTCERILLGLRLVTASRQGIVKGEGASLLSKLATASRT